MRSDATTDRETAVGGDDPALATALERHRPELWTHCYRIVGSHADAEDAVQETLLRAWRWRDRFEGRGSLRGWLYSIATNASLDALRYQGRRPCRPTDALDGPPARAADDGGPHPRRGAAPPHRPLHEPAPGDAEPDAAVVAKETIEHAFLAAIRHLSPKQRAVLVLRDMLGWPARDTAALLGTSVAATNSALQRARATLAARAARPLEWPPTSEPTGEDRALLRRLVDAHERADAAAVAQLGA